MAEAAAEAGVIPENNITVLLNALDEESRLVRRKADLEIREGTSEYVPGQEPQSGRPAPLGQEGQIPPTQPSQQEFARMSFPFESSIAENSKNFKALFGEKELSGTSEILRKELRRKILRGAAEEEAKKSRLSELDGTTKAILDGLQEALAAPGPVKAMIAKSLSREIERRKLLTGENPSDEVMKAWRALSGEAGPESYKFEPQPPAIPEQFADIVKRRKIGPGSKITVKTSFASREAGGVFKGRKLEVLGVDLKGGRLLVRIRGIAAIVNPNNFVETSVIEKGMGLIPTKQFVRRMVGISEGEKIGMSELKLLALKLRSQAFGAKIGARHAARETKISLLAEFNKQRIDEADIRRRIAKYAQDNLPLESRGKFLVAVNNSKTPKALFNTMFKIDQEAERAYKRSMILDIRKLVNRALESNSVAVEFRQKIQELMRDIETHGRTRRTIENLEKTRDFINRQKESGKDVEMPEEIFRQIESLSRRALRDLSETELENVFDTLKVFEEHGRIAQKSRTSIYQMRQERILGDLLAGTKAIEMNEIIHSLPGRRETLRLKLLNFTKTTSNKAQEINLAIKPADVVFDTLDGNKGYTGPNWRHFKARFDAVWASYRNELTELTEPVIELANRLRLNDQNFERIGVHAMRVQKNGVEYLHELGMMDADIQAIQLTDDEMSVYKAMREAIEKPYERVRKLLAELDNAEIEKIENYFPFLMDFRKMSSLEIQNRLSVSLAGVPRLTKTISKGFTKKRQGGLKNINVHAMDIFERHMNDVLYYVHTQRDIKMMSEIANSREYGEAAGLLGQNIVRKWLDVLARKGGGTAERWTGVDILRRNLGVGVLGFKLTSTLVQLTSLADGSALIGGKYMTQGMGKMMFDKEFRGFMLKNFPEFRERVGNDPAFEELSFNKMLRKSQKVSLAGIEFFDRIAAGSVAAGAYLRYLDENGLELNLKQPITEGIERATLAMRRTQSSPQFKDAPIAITAGGLSGNRTVDKALLQFKSFMLNRFSFIRHDIHALGWKEGNKSDAAAAYAWLVMANLWEMGIRGGSRAATIALLSGAGLKVRESFEDDDDMTKEFLRQILSNIPFVTDIAAYASYDRMPMPVVQATGDVISGMSTFIFKAKREEARMKGLVKSVAAMAALGGIPGSVPLGRFYNMLTSENRLKFPYSREFSDLKVKFESGNLLDDELVRYEKLRQARKSFDRLNQQFKRALDADNWESAQKVAEAMSGTMEKFKE